MFSEDRGARHLHEICKILKLGRAALGGGAPSVVGSFAKKRLSSEHISSEIFCWIMDAMKIRKADNTSSNEINQFGQKEYSYCPGSFVNLIFC